jgi:hypothetical protein
MGWNTPLGNTPPYKDNGSRLCTDTTSLSFEIVNEQGLISQ